MCAYYRTRQQGRVQCMQWKLATCTHAACQLVRMHTCVSVDPLALRGPRQALAINAEALGVDGRDRWVREWQVGARGADGHRRSQLNKTTLTLNNNPQPVPTGVYVRTHLQTYLQTHTVHTTCTMHAFHPLCAPPHTCSLCVQLVPSLKYKLSGH